MEPEKQEFNRAAAEEELRQQENLEHPAPDLEPPVPPAGLPPDTDPLHDPLNPALNEPGLYEEPPRRSNSRLYLGLSAAVLLATIGGLVWIVNSSRSPEPQTTAVTAVPPSDIPTLAPAPDQGFPNPAIPPATTAQGTNSNPVGLPSINVPDTITQLPQQQPDISLNLPPQQPNIPAPAPQKPAPKAAPRKAAKTAAKPQAETTQSAAQSSNSPTTSAAQQAPSTTTAIPDVQPSVDTTAASSVPAAQSGQFVQPAFGNQAQVEVVSVQRIQDPTSGDNNVVNVQMRISRTDTPTASGTITPSQITARNASTGEPYTVVPDDIKSKNALSLSDMRSGTSKDISVRLQVPPNVNALNISVPGTELFKGIPISN